MQSGISPSLHPVPISSAFATVLFWLFFWFTAYLIKHSGKKKKKRTKKKRKQKQYKNLDKNIKHYSVIQSYHIHLLAKYLQWKITVLFIAFFPIVLFILANTKLKYHSTFAIYSTRRTELNSCGEMESKKEKQRISE